MWSPPIGRYVDAFHGIGQNTSTAGIEYEGYLAGTAAARTRAHPQHFSHCTATSAPHQKTKAPGG
ncbi:hypothetical protein [Mycobacterium lepromatosis]|uniref:hypothetical protein n=1 Tax=Mycobacterium lepromatosis TaxID=480418 RepID=UPI000B1DE1A8|nr:hypothetical protein [Mycobacterium lepromatosis]